MAREEDKDCYGKDTQKPGGWQEVGFTKESWVKLKEAYKKAVDDTEDEFVFEGRTFNTRFAHYFIQFHDDKFKEEK